MKRFIIFLLTALLLTAPAFAAEADPSTPLRFGTSTTVYGIDAVYTVKTEGVASVSVTFADGIGYAVANYQEGKLKIAIASADPLNLSGSVAQVTAILENGTRVAPVLELTTLKYNGAGATENLVPISVDVSVSGNEVTVSVSAHNDFVGNSYRLLVAAYGEGQQMLAINMTEVTFHQKDASFSVKLSGCEEVKAVKAFFLAETFKPFTDAMMTNIPA